MYTYIYIYTHIYIYIYPPTEPLTCISIRSSHTEVDYTNPSTYNQPY